MSKSCVAHVSRATPTFATCRAKQACRWGQTWWRKQHSVRSSDGLTQGAPRALVQGTCLMPMWVLHMAGHPPKPCVHQAKDTCK